MASNKIKGKWYSDMLCDEFGHAGVRVKHARQLQGTYDQIVRVIGTKIGIAPSQITIFNQTLEETLDLSGMDFNNRDLVESKIARILPSPLHMENGCIIFCRPKDPESLDQKMKEGRNTHDTFGVQVWVTNPDAIAKLEKLERPKDPQVVAFKKKGIKIESIENFYAKPKPHGHAAIHVNIMCKANKGWGEGLEIQYMTLSTMLANLTSRNVYKTYSALKKQIGTESGENENNWDEIDHFIIDTLRDYIKALYEEGLHEDGLINLLNDGHVPTYQDEHDAHRAAQILRPIALDIVDSFYGAFDANPESFLMHKASIAKQLIRDHGLKDLDFDKPDVG